MATSADSAHPVTPGSRRAFLKAGVFGTLVLATAGGLYRAARPDVPERLVLDRQAELVLAAIIPVMLGNAMTPTAASVDAAIQGVQQAIAGLPLATQDEIRDLFALMTLSPSRRFLVGLRADWHEARPEDIAAFLQNWRTHRFALLQSAYFALHDLITGSWYAVESSWPAIGYPGPPLELS